MRICPNCGYKDTLTMRRFVRLLKVEFGDLPILEMIKRGWIHLPANRQGTSEIRDELRRFFQLKDDAALTEFLAGEMPLNLFRPVCVYELPPGLCGEYQSPRKLPLFPQK